MRSEFKTITRNGEAAFTEKGSKFMGYAFSMKDPADLKDLLQSIKSRHKGARHFCYAYVCGKNYEWVRSSDEGEPSGTAGKPILHQIEARDLTETLVVVVRYFGGILLGTGGLIQAYREAARLALEETETAIFPVTYRYTARFPYEQMAPVMQYIKRKKLEFSLTDTYPAFGLEVHIPILEKETVIHELKNFSL